MNLPHGVNRPLAGVVPPQNRPIYGCRNGNDRQATRYSSLLPGELTMRERLGAFEAERPAHDDKRAKRACDYRHQPGKTTESQSSVAHNQ